jgi:hypothetical protein
LNECKHSHMSMHMHMHMACDAKLTAFLINAKWVAFYSFLLTRLCYGREIS